MKAKRSNYAGVIALLVIGAAGVYGIGFYIKRTPEAQTVESPLRRPSEPKHDSKPADQADPAKSSSATVLTPKSENGNLTFESTTEVVPSGTDPIVFAVNRYLENSHIAPSAARAVKASVIDGMVCIDCSEAMEKTYGSADEEALLKGLAKTLSQFPNVKRMQFLVSGRPIDSFGNVDISKGVDLTQTDGPTTSPGA